LTDKCKCEEAIERWMQAIGDDGGVRRLDNLLIGGIDPNGKKRERRVEGGPEAFRAVLVVRDRERLPFAFALAFSLNSGDRPLGVDFRTRPVLDARPNPLSLYLFHRAEESSAQIAPGDAAQDLTIFGISESRLGCYYLEFRQEGADEYSRSVFVDG
jgi:hypothetical protein